MSQLSPRGEITRGLSLGRKKAGQGRAEPSPFLSFSPAAEEERTGEESRDG
jgi:hypothetical protein